MNFVEIFNYDSSWDTLQKGLKLTFKLIRRENDEERKLTRREYGEWHNIVYSWFTQPVEDKKSELYEHVQNLLREEAKTELLNLNYETSHEVFLQNYLDKFNTYTATTKVVHNMLNYMHRYWVPSQNSSGRTEIKVIFELSLLVWREVVFLELAEKLRKSIIQLVETDRNGEKVNMTLIKNVLLTYVKIGVMEEEAVDFYKEHFENEFIEQTRQYYNILSSRFITENSVSLYMIKAQERLAYEENMAKSYLINCTYDVLVPACEQELIESNMDPLQAEFEVMLTDKREDDLTRFYGLLSRISNGLDYSSTTMNKHIIALGKHKIAQYANELMQKNNIKNGISLVDDLLSFHAEYSEIIEKCFSTHKIFVQAMDEAFTNFVNVPIGQFNISEILNFFIDHILKGQEKLAEDELDSRMEATVRLFTYFDDKDIFYESFRRSLSRRLLTKASKEDAERNFIGKLKRNMGDIYTNSLEGMFMDIKQSEERRQEIEEYFKATDNDSGINFTVQVLNKQAWPINKQMDFTLPNTLQAPLLTYEKFHSQKVNERHKLEWLYNHGSVTVNYEFPVKAKTKTKTIKLELSLSVIQTSVLLLFNEKKAHTLEEIKDNLNVPLEELISILYPLMFTPSRLLVNKGPEGLEVKKVDGKTAGPKNLEKEDFISILPVKTKKKRIQYPQRNKAFSAKVKDSQSTKAKVEGDRQQHIDLAIVRVMKSRNTLNQQELIAEATKQLTKLFAPEVKMMKKRIEILMERDFLKRDEKDQRTIHYVA